ncbi:MAG: amidohydrolase [Candidatus Cloacimonetes bacterium]|nr:amidohydrolase [Candidatus Cloacimonadota bacterium]
MPDLKTLYDIRQSLHKVPEIAFGEVKTQEIIINELKEFTSLVLTRFEPTGLLYEHSTGEGEYILFRADMDALPITENTGCDFTSEHNGFMHACGHDMHITILIGLIQYVVKNNLKKNLLFLFQPAEEGEGGAEKIIKTGVFNKYKIKSAYALHITGAYKTGSIAVKQGIMLGIPQEFNVEITGKSSHVATPQKGIDAFLAGMSFYQEMMTLIAKRFPAQEPILFHIGKASAGTVRNIIPETCTFEGTFRCLKTEVKQKIINIMETVAESVEKSHEVAVKISFLCSYAPVDNDENLTNHFVKNIPADIVLHQAETSMIGEDFGYFSQLFPSVMFWLGTNSTEDLHSSKFLPDEKSIDVALEIYKCILQQD